MSTELTRKVERTLEMVERVNRSLDERGGEVRAQRRRERGRVNRAIGRRLAAVGVAVGVVSVLTIIVGLLKPIGILGFLAAVGVAIGIAALLFFWPGEDRTPTVPTHVGNGEMVQRFDSFLYKTRRALPAPAQTVVDGISAELSTLKATLERVDPLDPDAQDARRLMSVHLPGLVERYVHVPPAYRSQPDAEGLTVDQRLVEGLGAAKSALGEVSERLAKHDMDAFQTQGRFIQSRYGEPGAPA
ncbi:hypothetical protein [uncultured Sphingomonas sp.]|uniref:hypothetical protein n=1 Tax=uncultured Sphingomonas sp. TaxID=158754 RepID=UPI0025D515F3|nr:hypothetical protein [uncultured Sphingomonas sp.]